MNRDRFPRPVPAVWASSNAACRTDDCFADEVAIDFPSVGHFIERVRNEFLGEPTGAEILTTEVSLSQRDAVTGTVVPLEVPLREMCVVCGGRGETWTEPCADCCGTGDSFVRRPVRLSLPAGVADGTRVSFRVRSPHAESVRVEVRILIRSSAA